LINSQQGGNQVSLVAAGKDEDVWVVTETGLALYDGTEWRYFPDGELGIDDVTIIKVAPDDTVWFGSTTQGLASYWSP
jgi:ligand-binding sensor domain-containing protein